MDNSIRAIIGLMEDMPITGTCSTGGSSMGGGMATPGQNQNPAMDMMPGDSMLSMTEIDDDSTKPEDLAAAKKFVQLVGSIDKARELLDKIDDVMEVLDDGCGGCEEDDEHIIGMMAALIPDEPDLPTGVASDMMRNIASQINPSHRSM